MSRGLWFVLVLLFLLPARAIAAPEAICTPGDPFYQFVISCDNFDDRAVGRMGIYTNLGPKNQGWAASNSDSATTNVMQISNTRSFSGPNSMVHIYGGCTYSGDPDCAGGGFGQNFPTISTVIPGGASEVYARFYIFWEPGFQWSFDTDKMGMFVDLSGNRAPYYFHTFGHTPRTPGHLNEILNIDYLQNQNLPAIVFTTGQWYCLELHTKQGSGNGTLESWIDSIQHWNYVGNATWDFKWDYFMLSGYRNISAGQTLTAGFRYVDNLVVATQRIGCLGGGPPPPTPPAAPTGLRFASLILLGAAALIAAGMAITVKV